jgi:hypothetical protein
MKPLSTTSSLAFVGGYSPQASVANLGVLDYLGTTSQKSFQEGTPAFDELRYCLLREGEQSLLMAINCYARALDGLRAGAAYWSAVSLYYAAFFAIKSVLGNYGCWMTAPNSWIEVVNSGAGNIRLQHKTTNYNAMKGSHKVTWVAYYETMAGLSSFLTSPNAVIAKQPVFSKKTWLIDTRNDLNYYPQNAIAIEHEFASSFDPTNVPGCFGGRLQTMLKVSQACVLFAKESAIRVGLSTDVWRPYPDRATYVQNKITNPQDPALQSFYNAETPNLHF